MKGVFEISGNSRYDDVLTERYHFPSQYLKWAEQCVGDWIVYRETGGAGGRKAYIAVAYVDRINAHPTDYSSFYARVSRFLHLDHAVPYRDSEGRYAERFLRDLPDQSTSGRALRGRSVRLLEPADFVAIVTAGLDETLAPANAARLLLDLEHLDSATANLLVEPASERRVEQILMNRKIRDASFRGRVLDAYESTCAVTGLRIINGGGRAEAQAAHIWSVRDGGPDIVQNGIALSATAHWLFDRHLISLDPEYRLLVAHNRVPSELLQLFPTGGERILLPKDSQLWPKSDYVERHRDRFAGLN